MKTIKPRAGHLLMKLDPRFEEVIGGIVIADVSQQQRSKVGTVLSYTPYPEGCKSLVWMKKPNGIYRELIAVEAWKFNHQYKDIVGRKAIIEFGKGREFTYNKEQYFTARLEHIAGHMPASVEVKAVETECPRCPRCCSPGESNIMMVHSTAGWICPVCGMNQAGVLKKDIPVPDLNWDEEDEHFDREAFGKRDKKIIVTGA